MSEKTKDEPKPSEPQKGTVTDPAATAEGARKIGERARTDGTDSSHGGGEE